MVLYKLIGIYLAKFAAKFVLVTIILALLTLYPVWTAMATGGLIYLAAVNLITVKVALIGTGVLSFAQSAWLMKLKHERSDQSRDD